MAFAHFENVDFSDCIFLCEVCFIDFRLFPTNVNDFHGIFLARFFLYTPPYNAADPSEITNQIYTYLLFFVKTTFLQWHPSSHQD
jgi:hypothetical protein